MGKTEKLKFCSTADYIVPNPNANPGLAIKKTSEPTSGSRLQFQLLRRLRQEDGLSLGVPGIMCYVDLVSALGLAAVG